MTVVIRSGATDTDVINVLFNNVFTQGTFTWGSQADGFNAVNALEDATWNAWRPTSVPSSLTVDCGAPVTCDTLGVAAHNMASNGAGIQVQHSSDGSTWTTISAIFSPLTNDDIIIRFAATSARYWRVLLQSAVATIGVINLGQSLKFPCSPIAGHKPLHHARKVELLTNESMGGNLLGNRPVKVGAETNINVGQVARDWAENDLVAFEAHYNRGGAFFYCGAPSVIPNDMGYCWRTGGMSEMSITWVEGDAMADVSFDVRSYVAA